MLFFKFKINVCQLNNSTIEKVALALFWSLQHFEVYISVLVVVLCLSDHNLLTSLGSSCVSQAHSLDIRHFKGKDNVLADALSRSQWAGGLQ